MDLRSAPAVTLAVLLAPVAAGLLGTLLPAFGYLPALGGESLALDAWRQLWQAPGLAGSAWLSFSTGLLASVLSLSLVVAFCAAAHGTRLFARLQHLISPLLAVPHVTMAFALAFLIAPSGWLLRLLSPWASGFERPPDWLIVNDPVGLSLVAALVLKEVPFLFLMTLAALGQSDAKRAGTAARVMGYGAMTAWLKSVFPRVYAQIRLPVLAVLAFSISVVDMALVIGPGRPPTLAVQLFTWFNDPDLQMRFVAAAGALLQLALVGLAIAIWIAGERAARWLGRQWIYSGFRGRRDAVARWLGVLAMGHALAVSAMGLLSLIVWSFAGVWRFPEAVPSAWRFSAWSERAHVLLEPAWVTLAVGVLSAALALVLAAACLEREALAGKRPSTRALVLLYLPLIVPQIAFLFGLQVFFVWIGIDGRWLGLVWAHLVFVLPYVFLSLSDPYRALDPRYQRTAACLGAPPLRVFLAVKLPMLLRPAATAFAVGFAVSVAQYLPTMFAGAGRFATLTTEAVALSAGGDRRVIGAFAVLQMGLPFLAFALALALPGRLHRRRKGLAIDP